MSLKVNIDNVAREIPQVGDTDWGEPTTDLLNSMVSAIHKRSKLSGNETLSGTKTFTSPPVIPEPTQLSHPVRKQDLNSQQTRVNSLQSRMGVAEASLSTLGQSMNTVQGTLNENTGQISSLQTNLNTANSNITSNRNAFGLLVPIGTIIAVHPYSPTPNSTHWKLCNGSGILGNNFNSYRNFSIPNLTDSFLMGGSSHGTGGANSKFLSASNLPDHTHTMNHTHTHFNTSAGGAHKHNTRYLQSNEMRTGGSGHPQKFWLHSGGSGDPEWGSRETSTASAHQHAINIPPYTGNTGSIVGTFGRSFDNRPKYFKVKHYIRVA